MENWRLQKLLDLLESSPEDEFVIYAIAQEYQKGKNLSKAIDTYLKLKKINPQYVGLYYHLAAAYIEDEQNELAMTTYNEGIEVATSLKDMHALSELRNAKTNLEMELL